MIFARYISREFLKLNAFIIMFFLGMFCLIDFLEQNTRYFPKYKASGSAILEFYLTQLPKMFVELLPFSTMFAALITLWVFARSGEVAALRAAGQSVFRICAPLIALAVFFTAASFLLAELVVPRAILHKRKVETVKIEKQPLEKIFLESNWVKGGTAILHFQSLNQIRKALEGVEYFQFRNPSDIKEFVYAPHAVFDASKGVWVLENAVVNVFSAPGKLAGTRFAASYPTTVSSQPPRLLRDKVTSDQVSYWELKSLIAQSTAAGGAISEREVDLYQKVSRPFANLLFVFFALPFALRRERQADTYIGIVLCLAAAILYWVGNMSLRSLAQNSVIHPLFAAWTMPVVLAVLVFFVVHKLDKGQ